MREIPDISNEARQFARYLIGREPSPEIIARYASGLEKLGLTTPVPTDDGVIAFALRHPASLPFLDAASGFFRKQSAIRKRLLLLSAILETTRENAEIYLPQMQGIIGLLFTLSRGAVLSLAAAVLGWPLLLWAERSRP